MVNGLTNQYSTSMPRPPTMPDISTTCSEVMVPCAVARRRVLNMRASISCSIRQLMAKAAAASSQIPKVPATTTLAGGNPLEAKNIPMTAQKTANWVTRGLVSTQYCWKKPVCGVKAIVMAIPYSQFLRDSIAQVSLPPQSPNLRRHHYAKRQ